MARALMGHVGMANEQVLAFEIGRLRKRVAELEAELAAARRQSTTEFDLELHRIAEDAEPALA